VGRTLAPSLQFTCEPGLTCLPFHPGHRYPSLYHYYCYEFPPYYILSMLILNMNCVTVTVNILNQTKAFYNWTDISFTNKPVIALPVNLISFQIFRVIDNDCLSIFFLRWYGIAE